MFRIKMTIFMLSLMSSATMADGYGHHHRHHHHHGHHGSYYVEQHYLPEPVYYQKVVRYYPQPVIEYRQPAPVYYQRNDYDGPSPQGLLGGALGAAVGYQLGQGHPVAAGVGAATGAWLGHQAFR